MGLTDEQKMIAAEYLVLARGIFLERAKMIRLLIPLLEERADNHDIIGISERLGTIKKEISEFEKDILKFHKGELE